MPRSSIGKNTCSRPCDWTTSSVQTSHSASWPTTLFWSRCQTARLPGSAEIHRPTRLAVHFQPEDVRATVVPGDVESSFRFRCSFRVAVGEEDPVLFVEWAGDQRAVGRDDHRVARVEPLVEVRKE